MRNELFTMFKYPAMIKSAAFCAVVFSLLAVLLKNSIVIVPEVSEVRLCNVVAMAFGIFFGPAGVWGVAVGNIIGDLGGSLTIMSFFGFLGNFFSAWIPYKAWCVIGAKMGEAPTARPTIHSPGIALRLAVGAFCSLVLCPATIAISTELFAAMPAVNFFSMIILNNFGATILGIVLFLILCVVPPKWLPYWRNMMEGERELTFHASSMKYLVILTCLSFIVLAVTVGYMASKGLSLTVTDAFGQTPILIMYSVYALIGFVLGFLCYWRPIEEDQVIEL